MNTYSISEVAKILGLTLKATRRMVAAGQIITIKSNNTYRIEKEYFDNNLEVIKAASEKVESNLFSESVKNQQINDVKKKTDVVNWTDISSKWDNPNKSDMTYVDLFCGAGGLSKGLEIVPTKYSFPFRMISAVSLRISIVILFPVQDSDQFLLLCFRYVQLVDVCRRRCPVFSSAPRSSVCHVSLSPVCSSIIFV